MRIYKEGIGTFSRTKLFDKLIAPSMEPRALEIFQTLVSMGLDSEDKIYIFGYSRGAVIARVLAMCIVSSKHLISVSKTHVFERSVSAQIEMMCLFEPVEGKPRLNRSRINNHDVIIEPKVKNYVELLALEELRPHFSSETYSASRNTTEKVSRICSLSRADTSADRQRYFDDLKLRKTRKIVWFPGNHADIGGHGASELVGRHALVTALQELEKVSATSNLGITFPSAEISNIRNVLKLSNARDKAAPRGIFKALLHRLFLGSGQRTPQVGNVIQHFVHPICDDVAHLSKLTSGFPKYPEKDECS